jgi:3,4-dihydroxy 2-butanone 4-phosphate synthase
MSQNLLNQFGDSKQRVDNAIRALSKGEGIIITDNENRENEGDIVFAAETITTEQMALLIKECSGIVCLCLTEKRADYLSLPLMVKNNTSSYQTAFTVSIEAARGVTTGVSAMDRVTTIRTAIDKNSKAEDLSRPGHVFPLRAKNGGVLERPGHTEATVDMMKLSGLKPYGVLCELTNSDGSMAKIHEILSFAKERNMNVVTVEDIIKYMKSL